MNAVAYCVQWGSCITPSCPLKRGLLHLSAAWLQCGVSIKRNIFQWCSTSCTRAELTYLLLWCIARNLQISLNNSVTSRHALKYYHISFPRWLPFDQLLYSYNWIPAGNDQIKPGFISLHELQKCITQQQQKKLCSETGNPTSIHVLCTVHVCRVFG